jgi:potassium-transporting ATPase KdpC subunit
VRPIEAVLLEGLIEQHLIGRNLGIFGEPRVNVLELNLALELAFARHSDKPQTLR